MRIQKWIVWTVRILLAAAFLASGALLLLIPVTGSEGAAILLATMVGATITHLFVIGGSPAPAIVLGVLAGFVAWRTNPLSAGSARAAAIRQRLTPTA